MMVELELASTEVFQNDEDLTCTHWRSETGLCWQRKLGVCCRRCHQGGLLQNPKNSGDTFASPSLILPDADSSELSFSTDYAIEEGTGNLLQGFGLRMHSYVPFLPGVVLV